MQGKTNRAAHFITVLCLVDENGTSYFEGKVHGHLLEEDRGHQALATTLSLYLTATKPPPLCKWFQRKERH